MTHIDEIKKEVPKHLLGDEWADWDGYGDTTIHEGIALFLAFSFMTVVLMNVLLWVGLYFVYPRLYELHTTLPLLGWGLIFIFFIVSVFWATQLFLTALTEKNYFFKKEQIFIAFETLFGWVFRLAKLLHISRDRMGHSFIRVSNAVTRAYVKQIPQDKRGKILILLPRCLKKEQLQTLNSYKDTYALEVATVPGGELARKKIKELRPSFIIGVACERDLVSGIRDVAPRIPAVGIINQRPEGPCVNTRIDLDEVERAIRFYQGS